ncbi:glutamate receptor [Klebsormidium nitens]|uniref:Glutamate receptor n=1 Tax=Klebsormidium nitens TaxID=105231 RepID=A0A1Y1HXM6_KLENI|nr:glutamate receptor [Klebsormidium nitens]|eukprot:GAQ81929.1 glutamate receptor [Klebsormidium nitens]
MAFAPVLLASLLCVSFWTGVESRLPGANGTIYAREVYTVCTASFAPYVHCIEGNSSPLNFSGYSPEMFKRAASIVGWKPNNYRLVCLTYAAMLRDLTDPNGICDMATASITIQLRRVEAGIRFAYPDYHTGQGLMVYASGKKTNKWLFLRPFNWVVWLFLFLAALAVGVSTRVVEIVSKPKAANRVDDTADDAGVVELVWSAGAQIVNAADPMRAFSFPSRIIIFVWAFLILLLVAMYTGNAAAILTASQVDVSIQSINDLQGRSWGAYRNTVDIMHLNGWSPTVLFAPQNADETEDMLQQLVTGAIEGLVWDCGYVDYTTATRCEFCKVGDCITEDNRALAFWQNATTSLVDAFSTAILTLEETSELSHLHKVFIEPTSTICEKEAAGAEQQVTFNQVSGLWIVLAATIAVSMGLALIGRHAKLKHLHKILKIPTSLGASGGVDKETAMSREKQLKVIDNPVADHIP